MKLSACQCRSEAICEASTCAPSLVHIPEYRSYCSAVDCPASTAWYPTQAEAAAAWERLQGAGEHGELIDRSNKLARAHGTIKEMQKIATGDYEGYGETLDPWTSENRVDIDRWQVAISDTLYSRPGDEVRTWTPEATSLSA